MKNSYFSPCLLWLCICISGSWQSLFSQNAECGFQRAFQDASAFSSMVQADLRIREYLQGGGNQVDFRGDIVIPVIVHIVWKSHEENISDERVLSQIETMNRDFNGENEDLAEVPDEFRPFISKKGIRFCLAAEDPQGQPVSGIERKKTEITTIGTKDALYSTALGGSDAWDTGRYFNIWVADTGEFLTGFGTYPNQVSPDREGMVIHPKYFGNNHSRRYNLGRVAVHEAGHFFGLNHTWGDDEDCGTDDNVEDTPLQLHSYKGCPAYPQVTCGSSDMFVNFMDYVDDNCMIMFTQGQMDRMLAAIELFRPGLVMSLVPCIQSEVEKLKSAFQVLPNPTEGDISIYFKEKVAEVGKIEIYNSIGQELYQIKTVLFDGMKVGFPEMIPGIYLVRIGNHAEKLIKK